MDSAPRQSHALTPEQFGPYEVYERLGLGGMASVHRAKKRGPAGFERTVALKRMLAHLTEDRNFVDSFVREAKVASLLAHPNIAQVYDFGRINGVFYIAMELVGGFDLRKLLRHAHRTNEPIPLPVVLSILCELCEALDYAHSFVDETGNHLAIVHRDVSPSNMIVSPMGHVKVIDFGIAKASSRQLHTDTGSVKGKLGYMAPEVALGIQVTSVSDIFSAGVVAWELVTALPLFSARTDFETMRKLREEPITPPSRHNPICPALLDQVILAALAREPEQRLASARAFRTVLDQVAQQQGIQISSRAVADWMRESGPQDPVRASSTAARPLPLPPGPETRVTAPSRPNRISQMARPSQGGVQLRRSDEDIALATEIWGEDATAAPPDDQGDFSMDMGAMQQHQVQPPPPSEYVQSLPGTPYNQKIPSLATSQRVQVIAPSQPGFAMGMTGVAPAPGKSNKFPLMVLAGLAVVAGILGGVLYAKRGDSSAAPAAAPPANAAVHFVVEPAGSTVEVAGKDIGSVSPEGLDAELAPGVYSVAVRHEGYKTWTTSLNLREGDKQTINVALTGEPVAVAPPPPEAPPIEQPRVEESKDAEEEASEADKPDKPDRKSHKAHHSTSGTSHAIAPDPEPDKVDPPKVDPSKDSSKVDPGKDPAKVDPPKIDPPKVDPVKVTPPTTEPEKPKTTPVVGPTAVTKLSGEIPTLRAKSGDSSNILAKMCIDESGKVTSVSIKKSPPEIADDLQHALMSWRYKPYTNKDNKVTPVCFPLSIRVILRQ